MMQDEVQPEKVLEQEEGELSQEELPKTSNENGESIPNNNDTNTGEVSETTSAEIIKQQQIDKPPCRFFLRGICRYGDNCRFSHDDQSQQNGQGYQNGVGGIVSNGNGNGSVISNEVMKFGVLTHPRSSTPCRFFAKGYCRYGDDCKFSHIMGQNGNIVHHPHPPSQFTHYQQQPYDWNSFPQDGDNNNVIKPWDEDSQEVLDVMHQQPYY